MVLVAKIMVVVVALLHFYFLWLEMFAWTTRAPKVFKKFPKELFESMAANQGLYNGFLVAGLVWSILIEDPNWSMNIALFFLGCVVVAGIYGALSVSKKIFYIQGLPALLGIIAFLLSV